MSMIKSLRNLKKAVQINEITESVSNSYKDNMLNLNMLKLLMSPELQTTLITL